MLAASCKRDRAAHLHDGPLRLRRLEAATHRCGDHGAGADLGATGRARHPEYLRRDGIHWERYGYLGHSPGAIVWTMLARPGLVLAQLRKRRRCATSSCSCCRWPSPR
ncbi:MAG: hypothetical protein R3A10_08505 [Caldilineaceae bacterium]